MTDRGVILRRDPVVRRLVIAVVVLGLLLTASALYLLSSINDDRDRWAQFDTAVIGELQDDGSIIRDISPVSGNPVAGLTEVPIVFTRCGPDVDLFVRSRRTWTVRFDSVDGGRDIERIGGQIVDLPIAATPDCFRFQARIDVVGPTADFVSQRDGVVTLELGLVVEPIDTDSFIATPVQVEPFEVDRGQETSPDTVVVRPLDE